MVTIGSIIAVTGIVLFAKGVGSDQSSRVKIFEISFENKGSSIMIFLVGAVFILIGVETYNRPLISVCK
jgi:cytochrome b subunit of formate dehydrogenase